MFREKTALEKAETPELEADRLRYALFVISGLADPSEIKRVAQCAMAGEKHGHEKPAPKVETFMGWPVPPATNGPAPRI
jgi:hypothetical protein